MGFFIFEETSMTTITGKNWEIKDGHTKMFFLILKNLSVKRMVEMTIMELMAS